MGFKKFGTGAVQEDEQDDLSKTASAEWSAADERALEDEDRN